EELHLHLLELARPEDEVAGRDLVAESLADLCNAERNALAAGVEDVQEVDVAALRSLRAQVDDRRVFLDWPHERLEHEVEAAGLREVALGPFTRTDGRLERAARLLHLVRAIPRLALAAVDE